MANHTHHPSSVQFLATLLLCLLTTAPLAAADEIILKNGDTITGTIDSAADGKLVMISPVFGKITVALSDIKTFSTNEPIKIQLDNGTLLDQAISKAEAGHFGTAPGGLLNSPSIALARIVSINPPPAVWTGSLVINGLYAQSTTTSEQLGVSLDASRRSDNDRLGFGAAYLYGRQKVNGVDSTTDDNWHVTGDYNYFFNKDVFGYANVRVEKDRIELLDLRLTPGAGVGYQVVERPDFHLDFQGGVAWVYEQYTNVATPNQNVSARLAYHVDKTLFNSAVKAFSDLSYYPSVQNVHDYLILSSSGVHFAITKNMFSEVKAVIEYDSHPAPTALRTTTQYILGVGWTF